MPKTFKSARLWTLVTAAVVLAGAVSALGTGAAAVHVVIATGAI